MERRERAGRSALAEIGWNRGLQCGGQAHISSDDYVEGPPELVAEIAASTVSFDLHTKLQVYRRNGVREYIVWRVLDREIDWFVLREERYDKIATPADGIYRSDLFGGLWLDGAALIRGDMPTALLALQRGLDSPEHAQFVAKLQQAATKNQP